MARFDLSDEEWAVIEPLLPKKWRGPQRRPNSAEPDLLQSSDRCSLAGFAERYGLHTTDHNRYVRWGERRVWQGIFEALAAECEDALIFVDSSIVKAHRAADGAKGGSFSKVLDAHTAGSKVHAAVSVKGRPGRIDVTGAQTHDSKAFDAFLDWEVPPLAIVADRAYGSSAIRQAIADEGAMAVIPSKSNARVHIPHDPNFYAMRNLVERFFCKMKDMRRLTTRYEKLKRNILSMIHIFAIRCRLN